MGQGCHGRTLNQWNRREGRELDPTLYRNTLWLRRALTLCQASRDVIHVRYFTQSLQWAYKGDATTPFYRGEKLDVSSVLKGYTARKWQSQNQLCELLPITTTLFCLSFWKQRDKDQLFHKQNGDNRVTLFLLRNTGLDTHCKPPTKTYSKQIQELSLKSHVIGK